MQIDIGSPDVTVVGGGVAGMAASIHLAKAGLQVLCIEPDIADKDSVGESLDWSAPDLLRQLELPMERLLEDGAATWKRHVILKLRGGAEQHYVPSDWLARPPFNVELRTLHVDRTQLDRALRAILLECGVKLLPDKVVQVERNEKRVDAVVTASGVRICSRWFVDASGSAASLFPRVFELPLHEFGPRKVAMWDYFMISESIEGTTLYADGEGPPYMDWVWQIPIHANTVGVGYVSTGDVIKEKRQRGMSIEEIFEQQLGLFPELGKLLQPSHTLSLRTTSYRCRAYSRVSGPNWLVVGESAAMVDPMTSNGVTAALRHGLEASGLLARYRTRKQLPWLHRTMYDRRVFNMARFFNSGIEKVIYDWPIRNRVGALLAGDVYTIPAWSINNIYSRLQPLGVVSTLLFGLFLATLRWTMNFFYFFCKRSRSNSPVRAAS